MAILFSNEILDSVHKELQKATRSVQIITAYCKESSFDHIDSCINACVTDKRLMVRFRMDDVIKGSSDFSILEKGIKNGWSVFIRFDLHAKTYIVDNKRGLVGSANTTNSGLSLGRSGNMEMATLTDIDDNDIKKINRLFNDAIPVDQALIDRLYEQIKGVPPTSSGKKHSWDLSITSMFTPHVETLFSYEFPEEDSLTEGSYLSFIDEVYHGDKDEIRESLRWSNAYIWLLSVLKDNDGCMYFGGLTEKLHNAMISDPKPYRRDVKIMLSNLLSLIEELEMDEIRIDRPNYSQRVMLASDVQNDG